MIHWTFYIWSQHPMGKVHKEKHDEPNRTLCGKELFSRGVSRSLMLDSLPDKPKCKYCLG